eukprot:gene2204-4289_t
MSSRSLDLIGPQYMDVLRRIYYGCKYFMLSFILGILFCYFVPEFSRSVPVFRLARAPNNSTYVIENGKYREVSNVYTLDVLGLKDSLIKELPLALIYPLGTPIPDLRLYDNKDNIRNSKPIAVDRNSPFIINNRNLKFPRCNAAFDYWKYKQFVCSRMMVAVDESWTSDRMCCSWYDHSRKHNSSDDVYLTHPLNRSEFIRGEDPRVWVENDQVLHLIYNHINISWWPSRRMMMTTIIMNTTHNFFIDDELFVLTAENAPYTTQKNWTPFIYGNISYFIHSVQPHQILRAVPPTGPTSSSTTTSLSPLTSPLLNHVHNGKYKDLIGKLVASTMVETFFWTFGEPRGSTPALLIGNHYLTFFHSRRLGGRSGRSTYFIGAYTFSPRPPFQILAMTADPIVARDFYRGRMKAVAFDFIIFPTSFSFDDHRIVLHYGRQDVESWVMTLNRTSFLRSLSPVSTVVIGNCVWTQTQGGDPSTFRYID